MLGGMIKQVLQWCTILITIQLPLVKWWDIMKSFKQTLGVDKVMETPNNIFSTVLYKEWGHSLPSCLQLSCFVLKKKKKETSLGDQGSALVYFKIYSNSGAMHWSGY